ncbi:hypothetical protein [Flagellimonas nanhaiensis]|uniref:Uncharacterized protein n=1 Tax=Flagellimonas nanhaiensis TaxID=2292706 RepID=A0A371JT73_9FLAO|nr:hypothetical protein [Allomuricauda nanhaiensis]RDY61004.1 hypothetical protein DX873_02160 [Allomuricauda nanhaiensis]RDY61005.1 hypothetical protein DX873_02165 [Allomuricauda nanhaiensis]
MKAVLTIIAIIFFGTVAMAQDTKEVKVDVITAGVELNIDIQDEVEKETEVARLYKFKNARVKKALSFKTKKNRSKLA